jgi:polyhydroxybutyrate depolymerase
MSDTIAAIAPVSGTIGGYANETAPLVKIPEPSQPVSVIAFHGTADRLGVDYYGTTRDNLGILYLSVHDSVGFWVNADGCSKTAMNTTSSDGNTVKSVYSNGSKGTEVVLYTLVGGDHRWPKNTTDLIWDFFKNHPKQH